MWLGLKMWYLMLNSKVDFYVCCNELETIETLSNEDKAKRKMKWVEQ